MLKTSKKLARRRKGQGLVEYALLIAGVALISMAAVSLFGHKVNDLISSVATILPGAHQGDNGPIISGHLIETAADANGNISLDTAGILKQSGQDRLGANVFGPTTAADGNGLGGLIIESQ